MARLLVLFNLGFTLSVFALTPLCHNGSAWGCAEWLTEVELAGGVTNAESHYCRSPSSKAVISPMEYRFDPFEAVEVRSYEPDFEKPRDEFEDRFPLLERNQSSRGALDYLHALRRACGRGLFTRCERQADLLLRVGLWEESKIAIFDSCRDGRRDHCLLLYLMTDGSPLGRQALNLQCVRGDGHACGVLGISLHQEKPELALKLMKRGCELGSRQSCRATGKQLFSRSPRLALPFFERACEGGLTSACLDVKATYSTLYPAHGRQGLRSPAEGVLRPR